MLKITSFLLLFLFKKISSSSYKAAVVSFGSRNDSSVYSHFIREAGQRVHNADIIVFPEFGQIEVLPEEVVVGSLPCLNDTARVETPFLWRMSCDARENSIYVVYDMVEKGKKCKMFVDPHCTTGIHMYNTEVVLDREGRILTHYRKTHLFFDEQVLFTPGDGELVYFETDFGVTFGTFICYDFFFKTPSQDMIALGITDFVYSVVGNMGHGGIYSQGTALSTTLNEDSAVMLLSEVPKIQNFKKGPSARLPKQNPAKEEQPSPPGPAGPVQRIQPLNESYVFLAEPNLSKTYTFNFQQQPSLTCTLAFTMSSHNTTTSNSEIEIETNGAHYFTAVAFQAPLDKLFYGYSADSFFCGVLDCGVLSRKEDCDVFKLVTNRAASQAFDKLVIDVTFPGGVPVNMAVPVLATDKLDVFDDAREMWGFEGDGKGAKVWIQQGKSVLQPVLYAGIIGEVDYPN